MDLRQCEVLDFGGDLFGSQTQVVPPGKRLNRDARPGDARLAFAISGDLSIRLPISTAADIFSPPFRQA